MTHLRQCEPEHYFLLQQSDELLTQIITSPDIIMSEDIPRLQIQRTTLQNYDKSELRIWKYSTEASIRLNTTNDDKKKTFKQQIYFLANFISKPLFH